MEASVAENPPHELRRCLSGDDAALIFGMRNMARTRVGVGVKEA